MKKKILTISILFFIVFSLASCHNKGEPLRNSIMAIGQSYIAFITCDSNVFFMDETGSKRVLQNSEAVVKLLGTDQILILLHSDGLVDVRNAATGEQLTEKECLNYLMSDEDGTQNGTIADYMDLCKYFESHSDIQDIIVADPNCYVAKIDGKWYGDLIESNPHLESVSLYRIIGSVGNPAEYVLDEEGRIIRLPDATSAEFLMPDASVTYVDASCYEKPYFVGTDGLVYTMGPRIIPEFHDAVAVSSGLYMTAVVDKNGNAQIRSNSTSEEYKEALEWKNLVYLAVNWDSLVGIDSKGNVKFTSSIEEKFDVNYKELPKAKVK